MSENDYKCPNCTESIYTHVSSSLSSPIWDTRIYVCNGRLIWSTQNFDPKIYVPEEELIDLKVKYESLVLNTTAFLDSLVEPVEAFVSLLAEDDFYEEDEDPNEILEHWLKGPHGTTGMGDKVKNYFVGGKSLFEEEVEVLPPREVAE